MRYELRVILAFLWKAKVSAEEIQARLAAQFGEKECPLRTVQHWCAEPWGGREDLHDLHRTGRPPIDHLDTQILVCLDRAPFQSARRRAEILGVSHGTVLDRLYSSLGMKNSQPCWIPHQLTAELRDRRMEKSRELLTTPRSMESQAFRNIVTGDESWIYLNNCNSTE
jgi:hypothetical protein